MSKREQQIALALGGAVLIAIGHRVMEAELGKLGAPHIVGAVMLAAALRG
jgi:hypothetical protein